MNTEKIVLNFFIPFSNGKFIASCLMFSPDVYKMMPLESLFSRLTRQDNWGQVEFNDLDFWWDSAAHSNPKWALEWFNMPDWETHLSDTARDFLASGKYAFYTCHGYSVLQDALKKFPNAKIMRIVPDIELTKRNHQLKKPPDVSKHFPEYDVEDAFKTFNSLDIKTDLVFPQCHIYDEELFKSSILNLAKNLEVELDIEPVLEYRKAYLAHPMNKI